jgi:hypothetical protein
MTASRICGCLGGKRYLRMRLIPPVPKTPRPAEQCAPSHDRLRLYVAAPAGALIQVKWCLQASDRVPALLRLSEVEFISARPGFQRKSKTWVNTRTTTRSAGASRVSGTEAARHKARSKVDRDRDRNNIQSTRNGSPSPACRRPSFADSRSDTIRTRLSRADRWRPSRPA